MNPGLFFLVGLLVVFGLDSIFRPNFGCKYTERLPSSIDLRVAELKSRITYMDALGEYVNEVGKTHYDDLNIDEKFEFHRRLNAALLEDPQS